jgi:hypothetical protein
MPGPGLMMADDSICFVVGTTACAGAPSTNWMNGQEYCCFSGSMSTGTSDNNGQVMYDCQLSTTITLGSRGASSWTPDLTQCNAPANSTYTTIITNTGSVATVYFDLYINNFENFDDCSVTPGLSSGIQEYPNATSILWDVWSQNLIFNAEMTIVVYVTYPTDTQV